MSLCIKAEAQAQQNKSNDTASAKQPLNNELRTESTSKKIKMMNQTTLKAYNAL